MTFFSHTYNICNMLTILAGQVEWNDNGKQGCEAGNPMDKSWLETLMLQYCSSSELYATNAASRKLQPSNIGPVPQYGKFPSTMLELCDLKQKPAQLIPCLPHILAFGWSGIKFGMLIMHFKFHVGDHLLTTRIQLDKPGTLAHSQQKRLISPSRRSSMGSDVG